MKPEGTHHVGRAVFLGAVAGGVTSLYWGRAAWSRLSSAIGPIENAIPLLPSGGWRIYAVSGSLPGFDPKTWQLSLGGHVETPTTISYHELQVASEGRAGLDVPLRHRLDGQERPVGRASGSARCSPSPSRKTSRTRSSSSRQSSRTWTT